MTKLFEALINDIDLKILYSNYSLEAMQREIRFLEMVKNYKEMVEDDELSSTIKDIISNSFYEIETSDYNRFYLTTSSLIKNFIQVIFYKKSDFKRYKYSKFWNTKENRWATEAEMEEL